MTNIQFKAGSGWFDLNISPEPIRATPKCGTTS